MKQFKNLYKRNFENFFDLWYNNLQYHFKKHLENNFEKYEKYFNYQNYLIYSNFKITKHENFLFYDYKNFDNWLIKFIVNLKETYAFCSNFENDSKLELLEFFKKLMLFLVIENFNFFDNKFTYDQCENLENWYKQNLNKIDPKLKEKFLIEV